MDRKTKVLFALATLVFVACGKRVAPSETLELEQDVITETNNLVNPENRQDTVFFGYILGQSTKSITKQLINKGELKSKSIVKKSLVFSAEGFAQGIVAKGYLFDLYIEDEKYDALLSLYDDKGDLIQNDGKLMSLHIFIDTTDKGSIIKALKKQYGSTNTIPEDGYKVEGPETEVFWNKSNKAIYLQSYGGFLVLIYEDIIAVRNKNNSEAAAIETEKQHNLNQSKKTQL